MAAIHSLLILRLLPYLALYMQNSGLWQKPRSRKARKQKQKTNRQGYLDALAAIETSLFPLKALNRQKSYMHSRRLKKPAKMTLGDYMEHVKKMNEYLALFPPLNANGLLDYITTGRPNCGKAI